MKRSDGIVIRKRKQVAKRSIISNDERWIKETDLGACSGYTPTLPHKRRTGSVGVQSTEKVMMMTARD
jgi:hypothetical protein